ncbi:MAG TPA: hypothetical protein DEA08_21825 [Planctomycetes bacterium]|nr:hypothetical protein [Planctomycetota bacterium]
MKHLLSSFALLLALAGPAAAGTFTGTLERVFKPAPTEEDPNRKVEVHELTTAEGVIPLAELEAYDPVTYLIGRGPITLEGELVDGALAVERIAAPSLERCKGTLYRTKKGMAGVIMVQLEGQSEGVEVSGLPWLAFRKLTSDMSRHEIEFDAYPIRKGGKLVELVATRVKATATEDLVLTRNLLSYKGEVPKGQSVWLTRRSLVGISALVEGPDGQTGFALWDRLQVGTPIVEGASDRLRQD